MADAVLGVRVLMMFRERSGFSRRCLRLPLFESGFAPDALILAEEFRCALRIRLDRDEAVSKLDCRPTHRIPSAEAALLSSGRECSGIPLDELAHAHRRLACQSHHVVGEAIVATALMKNRHRRQVGDEVGWNAHVC